MEYLQRVKTTGTRTYKLHCNIFDHLLLHLGTQRQLRARMPPAICFLHALAIVMNIYNTLP